MKNKTTKNRGFTLIELLVVISIIGLLSSIVFAATTAARKKAQVAVLAQELKQIQNALELYRSDKGYYPYGNVDPYPIQNPYILGDGSEDRLTEPLKTAGLIPNYISEFPKPLPYCGFNPTWNACAYGQIMYWPVKPYTINPSGITDCGGKPVNGYIIVYYENLDSGSDNLPFPKANDGDNYCVTGN